MRENEILINYLYQLAKPIKNKYLKHTKMYIDPTMIIVRQSFVLASINSGSPGIFYVRFRDKKDVEIDFKDEESIIEIMNDRFKEISLIIKQNRSYFNP